jgi:hypothetical protein
MIAPRIQTRSLSLCADLSFVEIINRAPLLFTNGGEMSEEKIFYGGWKRRRKCCFEAKNGLKKNWSLSSCQSISLHQRPVAERRLTEGALNVIGSMLIYFIDYIEDHGTARRLLSLVVPLLLPSAYTSSNVGVHTPTAAPPKIKFGHAGSSYTPVQTYHTREVRDAGQPGIHFNTTASHVVPQTTIEYRREPYRVEQRVETRVEPQTIEYRREPYYEERRVETRVEPYEVRKVIDVTRPAPVTVERVERQDSVERPVEQRRTIVEDRRTYDDRRTSQVEP